MHTRTIVRALIPIAIAAMFGSCSSPSSMGDGGPGFKEAFFDEEDLRGILDRKDSEALRFYNARRSSTDTEGTVIAIGKTSEGKDDYNEFGRQYVRSEKLDGEGVRVNLLNRKAAVTSLRWVKAAEDSLFAVDVDEKTVLAMLDLEGCNGVRLVSGPLDETGYYTMTMIPVKIADGAATDLEGEVYRSTEPCPHTCGSESTHYLHKGL